MPSPSKAVQPQPNVARRQASRGTVLVAIATINEGESHNDRAHGIFAASINSPCSLLLHRDVERDGCCWAGQCSTCATSLLCAGVNTGGVRSVHLPTRECSRVRLPVEERANTHRLMPPTPPPCRSCEGKHLGSAGLRKTHVHCGTRTCLLVLTCGERYNE